MDNHEANQAAFSKVVRHLLKQGERSLLDPSAKPQHQKCAYRSPDGKQCAVGCLISDDEYQSGFENRTSEFVAEYVPSIGSLNQELLETLQIVHDDAPPRDWTRELVDVANRFGLTMPELEACHV